MKNSGNVKNSTAAYALLLATSPAWANTTKPGGMPSPDLEEAKRNLPAPPPTVKTHPPKQNKPGKSPSSVLHQARIASIKVAGADEKKMQKCPVPRGVRLTERPRPQRVLSLVFDPKEKQLVSLEFTMSKVPAVDEDYVLVLLGSQCLSSKPDFKTPRSKTRLALHGKNILVLGTYAIQAQQSEQTSASARRPTTIAVSLQTQSLAQQVAAGNETFYFQAAVLKKSDYHKRYYDDVILSPMQAVHFSTPKTCPNKEQFSSTVNTQNSVCQNLRGKTN